MSLAAPGPWLLLVAAVHLGFQLTVDLVVYPALREVPDEGWTAAHAAHSRRVAPLVAVVYVAMVLVLGWAAVAEAGEVGTWVALAGGLLSVVTTAAVAAPLHGRLGSAPVPDRPAMLGGLARADRVRTLGALVCVAGALLLVA